jgi:hypothetical protein
MTGRDGMSVIFAQKRAPDVANTTFNLCTDDVRIDGNAAIERTPNLVNARLAVVADRHLGDLCDVARPLRGPSSLLR